MHASELTYINGILCFFSIRACWFGLHPRLRWPLRCELMKRDIWLHYHLRILYGSLIRLWSSPSQLLSPKGFSLMPISSRGVQFIMIIRSYCSIRRMRVSLVFGFSSHSWNCGSSSISLGPGWLGRTSV